MLQTTLMKVFYMDNKSTVNMEMRRIRQEHHLPQIFWYISKKRLLKNV